MTKQMLTLSANLLSTGWTPAAAALAAAESVVDSNRFANDCDRILARYESDDELALFPSTDVLMVRGVNLFELSKAFEAGLTGEGFAGLFASMDVDTLNGAIANFVENDELVRLHPSPVDRAMHMWGECACA
ncbi:MAG: hypothetical protein K8F91_22055 [Candidatus Obscuribacterales bacterium]|nr:hypothetical protein [Candidatus Obscuribacterales bacterium]